MHQGDISGSSALINAPVQTASPKNYGGNEIHLGFGINFWPRQSIQKGNLLGIEVFKPIYQNKNNLQMKTSHHVVLGYQRSF